MLSHVFNTTMNTVTSTVLIFIWIPCLSVQLEVRHFEFSDTVCSVQNSTITKICNIQHTLTFHARRRWLVRKLERSEARGATPYCTVFVLYKKGADTKTWAKVYLWKVFLYLRVVYYAVMFSFDCKGVCNPINIVNAKEIISNCANNIWCQHS